MRFRVVAGLAWAAALSGCATFGQLEEGLKNLQGQPLSVAVAKIGYPSSERQVAGMRLVEWGRSNTAVGTMPVTSTTNGYAQAGSHVASFGATTTANAPVLLNFQCHITLEVDAKNIIQGAQYDGNLGGCEPYILALKPKK